jgi:hypothetical protein
MVTLYLLEERLRICVTLLRIRTQIFYFNADPNSDPAPHQNDSNLRPHRYLPGPPKLLNFDFIGDPTPNPAFHYCNVDPDPDPASQNTCGSGSTTPPKWECSLFCYFIALSVLNAIIRHFCYF